MSGFIRPSSVGPRLLKNSGGRVRRVEAGLRRAPPRERAGGGRRRRADRADRDDAHRRAAGVALRRHAARRGVVVVALVARRRQHARPRGGALGLERKEVQVLRLRRAAHVLHDDQEAIRGAAVHVVDRLDRILTAALHVGAAGDDAPGALLHEIQVVVVAPTRRTDRPRSGRSRPRRSAAARSRCTAARRGRARRSCRRSAETDAGDPAFVMPAIVVPSTPESA